MIRVRRTVNLVTAVAVMVLAACSSAHPDQGSSPAKPQLGGTLVFAIDSYPQDMNPYSATADNISIAVFGAWWEYLVRPTQNGTGYEPRLAASYSVSPDNTTYTFHLRKGVKFSDGTPMTVADVLFSLHHAFTDPSSQIAFIGPKISSMSAPDAQTVLIKLKTPWPYLLADLSGFNAAILNPLVKAYVSPSALVELIPLNVTKPPLNNEKIRQAISLAIDRASIVKADLFGYAKPATTFVVGPSAQTFQNTSLNLYPFDLAKARKLVKQSGVPTPIHLRFRVSQGVAQAAIVTIAQAGLAQIGIHLDVRQADFVSNENALDSGKFTMNTTFWGNFVGDPSEQPLFWMDPAYCCKSYFTDFNDPASIALVHKATSATSVAAARPLFDEVQRKVAETAHAIPLYFPELTYVASRKLLGFEANPHGTYPFEQFSLSK